jgi:hypothetical protein
MVADSQQVNTKTNDNAAAWFRRGAVYSAATAWTGAKLQRVHVFLEGAFHSPRRGLPFGPIFCRAAPSARRLERISPRIRR